MMFRLNICFIVSLACALTAAHADLSSATILPSLNQTVATPVRSGWRVVESLRFQASGLKTSNPEGSDSDSDSFSVQLDPAIDFYLQSATFSSAIFAGIELKEQADGQQALHVEFVPVRNAARRCITETLENLLFLVCTQLFSNRDAAASKQVAMKGALASEPPKLVAVKRKAIVHPMSLQSEPGQLTTVPLYEVSTPEPMLPDVENAQVEADISEMSVAVYRKVPPKPAREKLMAFAPAVVNSSEELHEELPSILRRSQTASAKKLVATKTASQINEPRTTFLGIKFDNAGQRSIVLPFSGDLQFSTVKINQSQYRIFIPKADVEDERLLNSFFVPVEYQGFAALEVTRHKDGIEVFVYIDRNSRINVVREERGLRLTAVS